METLMQRIVFSSHLLYLISLSVFWSFVTWNLNVEYGASEAATIVSLVQFFPILILIPITFILIDRFKKENLLIVINLFRFIVCIIGGIFIINGASGLFILIIILLAVRAPDSLYNPAVRVGIGGMHRPEGKRSSQYILSMLTILTSLIAPLILPLTLGLSLGFAVIFIGIVFGVTSAIYYFNRSSFSSSQKVDKNFSEWKSMMKLGWMQFREIPVVKSLILTLPAIDFALAATVVMYPLMSKTQNYISDEKYYALLLLVVGASKICGNYIAKWVTAWGWGGKILSLNCFAQGVFYLIAFLLIDTVYIFIPLFAIGTFSGVASLSVNEIIQKYAPEESRGRVFTLVGFTVFLFMPFGPLLSGVLSIYSHSLIFAFVGFILILIGYFPLKNKEIKKFNG